MTKWLVFLPSLLMNNNQILSSGVLIAQHDITIVGLLFRKLHHDDGKDESQP